MNGYARYLWPRIPPQRILCTRVVFLRSDNWKKGDMVSMDYSSTDFKQVSLDIEGWEFLLFPRLTPLFRGQWSLVVTLVKADSDQGVDLQAAVQRGRQCGANVTWDRLNTQNVLVASLQFIFNWASLIYLAILIRAEHWCESRMLLHFLGHQIITQLGTPKGMCSPRHEARGSPRRPVPILPTWLLCLPSSERQISFILKLTFSTSLIHTD